MSYYSNDVQMSKTAFNSFVTEIALHFGQDKFIAPSENTKKRLFSWFSQVKHLPDEPLSWIASQIKQNNECFPRNLSKTILEYWELWLKHNPKKFSKANQAECPYCVNGWILAYSPINPVAEAVRCGHCSRSCPDGIWQATIPEIEARGYTVQIFNPLHEPEV
mgnify:CR=1 FL=1